MLLPVHIIAGGLAMILGAVALAAPKGATLHRKSGLLFVCAMLVMGFSGSILALRLSLTNMNALGGLEIEVPRLAALADPLADPSAFHRGSLASARAIRRKDARHVGGHVQTGVADDRSGYQRCHPRDHTSTRCYGAVVQRPCLQSAGHMGRFELFRDISNYRTIGPAVPSSGYTTLP